MASDQARKCCAARHCSPANHDRCCAATSNGITQALQPEEKSSTQPPVSGPVGWAMEPIAAPLLTILHRVPADLDAQPPPDNLLRNSLPLRI